MLFNSLKAATLGRVWMTRLKHSQLGKPKMSLHQKQYQEPPAIEVDPATLHAHIRQLRHALKVTINSYVDNGKKGYPSELMQRMAADVLKATEGLYFPP